MLHPHVTVASGQMEMSPFHFFDLSFFPPLHSDRLRQRREVLSRKFERFVHQTEALWLYIFLSSQLHQDFFPIDLAALFDMPLSCRDEAFFLPLLKKKLSLGFGKNS